MAEQQTHLKTNPQLVGSVVQIGDGTAVVKLETTEVMAVDAEGLVHGGFIFGQADYAAMCAVNDPNVVLGKSSLKFLKPIRFGETVVATATVDQTEGKKSTVQVDVTRGDDVVCQGEFICFTLDKHVLS